ncbi:PIN domain-like protein [Amylostereum chailletii]|nr:PIN domain-like protein [Amylostereum chailletii]
MGVTGLTPFLRKTCPEVIKKLPDRLKSLRGKTVVIDGTLITQRLHFAPMPHPYRHVLGWYRLVQELRESGVQTLCVFDGNERNEAKFEEIVRRRITRQTDTIRSQIEQNRLRRFAGISLALQSSRSHDPSERRRARIILRRLMSGSFPMPLYFGGELASLEELPDIDPHEPTEDDVQEIVHTPMTTSQKHTEPKIPTSTSVEAQDPSITHAIDDPFLPSSPVARIPHLPFDELSFDTHDLQHDVHSQVFLHLQPPDEFDYTAHKLYKDFPSMAALYLEYRDSVSKLDVLPEASPPTTSSDPAELRARVVMSKTQHQLALEEGKFWERLAANGLREQEESSYLRSSLASIAEKSQLIAESYDRRSNTPTEETYEQCLEILRAMGVPCIISSGPYEAEALAASLVLHGHADYVASEDADVLVYEAPLMRNITSRKEPLTIISGADVRAALALDSSSYIDFALLLGTDFSSRIKNIGPHRALKFIRAYKSIEDILVHETDYSPSPNPEAYMQTIRRAREVFRTLPPVPSADALEPGEYDEDEVSNIMERYNLHRYLAPDSWDHAAALDGNFFADDPVASSTNSSSFTPFNLDSLTSTHTRTDSLASQPSSSSRISLPLSP